MTPDHMREIALIQISQSQRNAPMTAAAEELKYHFASLGYEATVAEAKAEADDYSKYASSEKEWPHHRKQAQDKAAAIYTEIKSREGKAS